MRVAALQLDLAWEQREVNFQAVAEYAERAHEEGAELLVLPEMFATGFALDPLRTAEPAGGETSLFLRNLARRHNLALIGGLVLQGEGDRGRNAALAVGPDGEELALYVKTHLFSYMNEQLYHEAGAGPVLFELGGLRLACFICYDLRFPELFRQVAEHCDAVVVIASWPAARQRHWDLLLPARATENQLYLVGVNRTGQGGGLTYVGGSAIYDPLGEQLALARGGEELISAELDPGRVAEVRAALPFLGDRRF